MRSKLQSSPRMAAVSTANDAAVYDTHVVPRYSSLFGRMLLAEIPERERVQVLDIGCGTGHPALEVLSRLGLAFSFEEKIAGPLGLSIEDAAFGARRIAVANMMAFDVNLQQTPSSFEAQNQNQRIEPPSSKSADQPGQPRAEQQQMASPTMNLQTEGP